MSNYQSIAAKPNNAPVLERSAPPTAVVLPHQEDVDHLTILAHDLRNYLTPVSAQLAMIHGRAQREERELDVRAAARGRQALDYALLLIANLLDAARMERGLFTLSPEPLDFSALVQGTAEVFETSRNPIVLCMPETLAMRADHERLRQVLHNLLANALTYSPRGIPVTLQMRIEQRDCTRWVVLTIRSGGPAIPAHLLPQLFQRFVAGPDSQGLGLGLYMARGIAEAHGSTLTAHSNENASTCFVLTLPIISQ